MKSDTSIILGEWVERHPELVLRGSAQTRIDGVSIDSRHCGAGDLFIAVRGERADGHDYLEAAAQRGCSAVMVDRRCDVIPDLPHLIAPRTAGWPALIARALSGRPDAGMRTVGITGTNGKTTTAWLVHHLLQACVGRSGLLGTILYQDGRRERNAPLTTPDGITLYDLFGTMRENGCVAAALEISSHALDQERVAGLELDVAVLTNLSRDHLDYHADMADYLRAKAKILDLLRGSTRMKAPGRLVLNADEAAFADLDLSGHEVLRYSAAGALSGPDGAAVDLALKQADLDVHGSRLVFTCRGADFNVDSRLIGRFNVENLCAAMAVGMALDLPPADCAAALRDAPQVPGRLEIFALPAGGHAVVDYAHTPDALAAVLDACRELTGGPVIAVFGCGGDRDIGKRPQMGAIAARKADRTWITSDNPRSEAPSAIMTMIEAGYRAVEGSGPLTLEVDRRSAILNALREADSGDVIVIAGKGHEDYQMVGDRRLDLDDRQIVRDWLESGGQA